MPTEKIQYIAVADKKRIASTAGNQLTGDSYLQGTAWVSIPQCHMAFSAGKVDTLFGISV